MIKSTWLASSTQRRSSAPWLLSPWLRRPPTRSRSTTTRAVGVRRRTKTVTTSQSTRARMFSSTARSWAAAVERSSLPLRQRALAGARSRLNLPPKVNIGNLPRTAATRW